MLKRILLISCMIFLVALALPTVRAEGFIVTLDIKYKNNLGDLVSVPGNLTKNGVPVTDAFVAIEIDNPFNSTPFIVRTLTTGSTPAAPWFADIPQFFTCDSGGNLKSSFKAGGTFGLKVTVRNNLGNTQHVNLTVTLFYSNMVPFLVYDLYNADMDPNAIVTTYYYGLGVPFNAVPGQAFAYASALSAWPKNGGYALCPENSTSFTITGGSGGGGVMQASEEFGTLSLPGEFNVTFRTNGYGGYTGNYTATATSLYQLSYAWTQEEFNVYLIGDNNGDGKVRVDDVLYEAQHFGLNGPPYKNPPDPGWDPVCDWTGDGKVRVDDILLVAQAFGKYGSP